MVGGVVAVGQEDVVGLEVAVDDAGGVRGRERRRDLARDPQRAPDREAVDAVDLVGQQRALEELEHDVRHAVAREPHVGRLDDVGVAERAGGARLVHEALEHVGVLGELGAQELERDARA